MIGKSHQTCIYSKTLKRNKHFRLYVGLTGIDVFFFWVLSMQVCQVWWLFWVYVFFWPLFGTNMLIVFEYISWSFLKIKHHQNQTNRMCIKQRNLYTVFSEHVFECIQHHILVSDTLPPPQKVDSGGGLPFVSIYISKVIQNIQYI